MDRHAHKACDDTIKTLDVLDGVDGRFFPGGETSNQRFEALSQSGLLPLDLCQPLRDLL